MAVEDGARAVICALHRQHVSASRRLCRTRPGADLRGARAATARSRSASWRQALVHGARLLQVDGNFDDCLNWPGKLAERVPGGAGQLGQPGPARGPEDRGVRDRATRSATRPDVHCIPVGNAGNITAYWRGYREYQARRHRDARAAHVRLPGRQARRRSSSASRCCTRRRSPPRSASATPRRWTLAEQARDESGGLHRRGDRPTDPRRLPAARPLAKGSFVEPASAAQRRRAAA